MSILKNSFLRDALTISTGTVIAQIVPLVLYPLLARIYTPEDFGLLAIILAVVPILTITFTGMYEGGILVSESKKEAANLVFFILFRSFIVFCIVMLLYFIVNHFTYLFPESNHSLIKIFYVVPICALSLVFFNCFNEWCVTYKYFINLSFNKMFFTSSIGLSKIFFGLTKFIDEGLIFGDLLGKVLTAKYSVFIALKKDSKYFFQVNFKKFKYLRQKFINFPKFLLPDQLVNNLSGSVHVFFIGLFFGNEELGYFAMAASLLTVPVTVITAAVKDVFREKANREYKISGNCRPLIISTIKPITFISLIFFIPIYFILPQAFVIGLGDQWINSGIYAQILVPMYITNFISMSFGGILIISDKMNISFYWQIYNLTITIFAILIGYFYYNDIKMMLIGYMLARTSAYLLYIVISYYYAKNENNAILN